MRAFPRYVLYQVPGWLFVGFLLVWLWPKSDLSPWIAAVLFAAWVAKDFALYPLLRVGYETGVATGAQQLVGARGVARGDLDPRGYVHVAGELWRAEIVAGHPPIAAGAEVRVEAAEGLKLYVSAKTV